MLYRLDFSRATDHITYLQRVNRSEYGNGNWSGPLFFLLIMVLLVAFSTYPSWSAIFKKRKFSPAGSQDEQLMRAYVSLTGIIVPCEPPAVEKGLYFTERYFTERFGGAYSEIAEEFETKNETPDSMKSLVKWVKSNLDEKQKKEMIAFGNALLKVLPTTAKFDFVPELHDFRDRILH